MAASLWWDEPDAPTKSDQQSKNDDLLVFGYACKLFRDDDKAKDIEKGKLLIPWMGDERLMIDRYDGRGHLFDLAAHDADNVEDKHPTFSEEEEAIEKACDEERFLELHTDLREAQMYEEEEWKRYYLSLQEGYQAVGFSYDQQSGNFVDQQQLEAAEVKEEDEKPFVVPPELQVPSDMQTPTCIKQNARIEKTANFIAQHGIQMEIMLKTKQAGNSQFDFLHFENELNPYYKHVVGMIKSGRYKPVEEEEESKKDDGQHYLHPSLSSTTQLPPPPPPPSKPIELPKVAIHDTPYGALIKSIRKNTPLPRPSSTTSVPPALTSYGTVSPPPTSSPYRDNPPPPGTEPVTLPIVSSLNGQAFVDQLYSQPPPPGTEDDDSAPLPSQNRRRKRSHSSDSSSSSSSSKSSSGSTSRHRKRGKSSRHRESRVPARVEGPNPIVPPPPDIQPIIDRMAMYVAKNGVEFEMVVMSRRDPRFQFLNEYHAHYPYYKLKKERYLEELGKSRAESDSQDDRTGANNQRSVSFSIKPRPREQEGGQAPGKPRLFEYDSSEGEDKGEDALSENLSGATTPTARLLGDDDSQKEIEEKLKDKLASAAKERISQTHKEKQLQLERKRKAAMFLNRLKTSQSSESSPPSAPPEDSASLYVGEGSPKTMVFEYDNQPTPQQIVNRGRRSRSPKERRKRRRSPTPPSAYSLDRRSPARPSPPRWSGRPGAWGGQRERTPPWQRRSRDRAPVVRRSRSRSPYRKEEKKKKHKRSKSKSPLRHDRNKEKSRHSREKIKHKSKEREKKEKSRHRSKERDNKHTKSKPSDQAVASAGESSTSDVEILDKSPASLAQIFTEDQHRVGNGTGGGRVPDVDISSIPVPEVPSIPSSSADSVLGHSKSITNSESTDDLLAVTSRTTSQANSPATHTSLSRGSTPSRSSTDTTAMASTDLMSKVRAMLKKSREMILKEEGYSLEDT